MGVVQLVDAEYYALDVSVPNNDLEAQIGSRFYETGQSSESLIIYLCFGFILFFFWEGVGS